MRGRPCLSITDVLYLDITITITTFTADEMTASTSEKDQQPRRLLYGKQPLSPPSPTRCLNPTSQRAEIQLRVEIGQTAPSSLPGDDVPTIEFDSSRAPQPFLDGEKVLARMVAARDEAQRG